MPVNYDLRLIARRWILFIIDTLLILTALLIYLTFFHHYASSTSFFENPVWALLIIVLWFFYASIFNLYKLSNVDKISETIKNTVITAVLTGLTYLFIPFFSPTFPLHRLPAFMLIANMVILLLLWRLIYARFFEHPILIKKSLVIGAGWTGRELVNTLVYNENIYHNTGYKIYGYIDDDENKAGKIYDGFKVLGKGDALFKFARRLKIDELILAIPEHENINSKLYAGMIDCENANIPISYAYDIYEAKTGKVLVKQKEKEYFLANPYNIIRTNRFYQVANRVINLLCAIIACTFFLFIVPFIWVINLMFNKGPLFYKQERLGKNGKKFTIIKFRTMVVDAEKLSGPQYASKDDERVTPFGRILRRTRLDELPQAWNILKGEMNIIGPRPEREIFVEELTKSIPFFKIRNTIKPGLTGWAQVNYKYTAVNADSLVKLQYDLYYMKHRSFLLDLNIIMRTIAVILKFKGT